MAEHSSKSRAERCQSPQALYARPAAKRGTLALRRLERKVRSVIGLRQLMGMPVVRNGEPLGFVERGVLTEDGARLQGLIVRRGLGMAKWAERARVEAIGERCVLLRGELTRLPPSADVAFACCYDAAGRCLGMVTDALLHPGDLRVLALELCVGPFFSLSLPKAYALEYSVKPRTVRTQKAALEVVATRKATWNELAEAMGKEEQS